MNAKLNALVHARWFETTIMVVIILAGSGRAGDESCPRRPVRHLAGGIGPLGARHLSRRDCAGVHASPGTISARAGGSTSPSSRLSPGAVCSRAAAARALRLLRLVTALPRLQLLVGALLKSLGAMGYVGLLLALMFYIYGVAGVHLFREADAGHFGSLKAALLSLFQVITLDNWSDIYRAARAGAPVATPIYFISFILLGTMIMLNLFIGIVMNSMSEMHAEIAERDRQRHVTEDRRRHHRR